MKTDEVCPRCDKTMDTYASSSVFCRPWIYASLTLGIAFVCISVLIQHKKKEQLNRIFQMQEQHPWSPVPISSGVNDPAFADKG